MLRVISVICNLGDSVGSVYFGGSSFGGSPLLLLCCCVLVVVTLELGPCMLYVSSVSQPLCG